MVAITVILAAVIGTFVLNLGGDLQETPQAQLSVEQTDGANTVTISHNGGDTIQVDNIRIETDNSGPTGNLASATDLSSGDSFSVGDEGTTSSGLSTGQSTVKIIHTPSDSILVETTINRS
jgi:FlaG/FlaF family flagellin (archaellin)